jgi:hypothetical protein
MIKPDLNIPLLDMRRLHVCNLRVSGSWKSRSNKRPFEQTSLGHYVTTKIQGRLGKKAGSGASEGSGPEAFINFTAECRTIGHQIDTHIQCANENFNFRIEDLMGCDKESRKWELRLIRLRPDSASLSRPPSRFFSLLESISYRYF